MLAGAVGGVAAMWGNWAAAQISYTGTTYLQDFDSLTNTTQANYATGINNLNQPPANASGLVGWQAVNVSTASPQGTMQYVYDNGNIATLGLLGSYGVAGVNPVTDRALGSVSTTPIVTRFGVRLVNNTTSTFTTADITFDLEQWRRATQTTFTNTFSYLVGPVGSDINSSGFTTVGALAWNSINRGATVTALDGNDPANRANLSVSNFVIGSWAPGQVLVLRWDDVNDTGSDDVLAIDNLAFTAGGTAPNLIWNAPAGGTWDQVTTNKPWLNGAAPSPYIEGAVVNFGSASGNVPVAVDPPGVNPATTNVSNNNAAGTYTFDGGPIGGVLQKSGAGGLILKTSNNFTNAVVTGGAIETQVNGGLGTGNISVSNANWKITTNPQTYTNAIQFAGNSTVTASVPLDLGGATVTSPVGSQLVIGNTSGSPVLWNNTIGFAGNMRVKTGTVKYAGAADGDLFPNSTIITVDAGATFDFGVNGDTIGGIQGAGTIILTDTTGSFLNLEAAGDRTFSGIITGTTVNPATVGLHQDGGGVLTLTGKSNFVAPTLISNGTIVVKGNVRAGEDGPLGNTDLPITLVAAGGAGTTPVGLIIGGPFEISRPIITTANTNTIAITIGGNTNDNSLFSGAFQMDKSPRLTSVASGSNAVTFSGMISSTTGTHGITKIGPGIVVLSNPDNAYTSTTTINDGTLRVTGSIATSSGVFITPTTATNLATFEAAATQTVKALTINTTGLAKVTGPGGNLAAPTVLTIGDGTTAAPLTIDRSGNNTAKLDVGKSGVVVDYSPGNETANLVAVRDHIIAGFNKNGAAWTGPGIVSPNAAADTGKAVGYGQASDILGAGGGTFMGKPGVDDTSILVRYTIAGDANLSGNVDFTDLVALAQNYGSDFIANPTTDSWWTHGDFNYDGKVDFNDLVKLAQAYNQALPSGPLPGASANFEADFARALAMVPEPGALALLGCAPALATRRRRRGRR
jgi:autotransporter-associated beta strand protein